MGRQMANRRVAKELQLLSRGSAAPGIAAWPREQGSRLDVLDAEICGAADTPYEGGVFKLEVNIPPEYPLKPPRVNFITKIYHPNIDSQGRICLDSLNMPPKGAWKPSLNVATLLTSIQALMSSPNADDGLMVDITDEFRRNPGLFRKKAVEQTNLHARPHHVAKEDVTNNPSQQPSLTNGRTQPTDNTTSAEHSSNDDLGAKKDSDSDPESSSTRLRKRPRHA